MYGAGHEQGRENQEGPPDHESPDGRDAGMGDPPPERAGGDLRGGQSAALIVVSSEFDPDPWKGVLVDLRVDDQPPPSTS